MHLKHFPEDSSGQKACDNMMFLITDLIKSARSHFYYKRDGCKIIQYNLKYVKMKGEAAISADEATAMFPYKIPCYLSIRNLRPYDFKIKTGNEQNLFILKYPYGGIQ